MFATLITLWKNEDGATAIEYGLIAALIAVAAIAAMQLVGTSLTATFNNVGDVVVSGTGIANGSGTVAVVKQNTGTLFLNVASTYTGGTTLSGGAITLGADNALGGSSSSFAFAGGTLNANDHSASIGALSLTANSTLNLVADATHATLTFTSGSWSAGVLTINGWSGVLGQAGTDDHIFISGTASAQLLADIDFTGYQAGAMQLGNGEIVPVPEPINVALGVFGVVAGGVGLARRVRARRSK